MATVGFVGLGVMGTAMVNRLLDAGHTVHGFNRTRAKAEKLVQRGLILEETPRAAAERGDIVFSMVTSTPALEAVLRGPDGILAALGPGKIYIDSTTGSPASSKELAAEVEVLGARMLDAPISGAPIAIDHGRAAVMVGGDPEAFEAVVGVLRDIGPVVHRIGGNGQALMLKVAINLSLFVQMTAFSEGLLLAERAGIDREIAVGAMLDSVAASPMLKYRAPLVLDMPEEAWFDCNMMQKDMLLALDSGREFGVPLPMTAASNELLSAARGLGLAQRDFAIVYEVLAALAGAKGTVA